jgi:hypothetical protein
MSPRAIAVHVTTLIVAPLCLVAAWWQTDRALSGNALSYMYAVEWPLFAGVAVWAWWHVIHTEMDPALRPSPTPPTWLTWNRAAESPELRAYNQYLLELHITNRHQGWRRFRRAPVRAGLPPTPPALAVVEKAPGQTDDDA